MIKEYFNLSWKSLKHRGLRSWLTMLGIFIGIAAVVALISLGSGLRTAITGQFNALSVDKLTLQNKGSGFGPPGSAVAQKLNDHDVKIIEGVSGVEIVVPRLVRVAKIEYNKISSFFYVVDLPDESKKADFVYDSFNIKSQEGRLLTSNDRNKILLGSDIAKTKSFDKDLRVGSKVTIEGKDFEIIGVLEPTGTFQVNNAIIIPTKDLQEVLGIEDEWDVIGLQVEDKDEIEQIAQIIENRIRQDRNEKLGEESFSVETPAQVLSSVNTILNIINIIIIGIAAISLFVGAVGITNTMYTSVLERRREIGIMKAIGARNSDVLLIFLIEAGLLGLAGGIIGAVIGLGLAFGAASAANGFFGTKIIEISISYSLLFSSILFALLVGIAAGTFPAYRASKLNVVDAIKS
ncbi:MAG: ABC transporter permease [Nanoarchaeota archaeon]|nr:ABC transporter permease [Nanoarchaeota archaeon]